MAQIQMINQDQEAAAAAPMPALVTAHRQIISAMHELEDGMRDVIDKCEIDYDYTSDVTKSFEKLRSSLVAAQSHLLDCIAYGDYAGKSFNVDVHLNGGDDRIPDFTASANAIADAIGHYALLHTDPIRQELTHARNDLVTVRQELGTLKQALEKQHAQSLVLFQQWNDSLDRFSTTVDRLVFATGDDQSQRSRTTTNPGIGFWLMWLLSAAGIAAAIYSYL